MWNSLPLAQGQGDSEEPRLSRANLARLGTESFTVPQSVARGSSLRMDRGAPFAYPRDASISGNTVAANRRRSAPPRTLPVVPVPPIAPAGSFAEVHLQQGIARVHEEVRVAHEKSSLIQTSLTEAGEQGHRLLAESEWLEARLAEARAELASERCALDFAKEDADSSDVELELSSLRAQIQRLNRSNESLEDALQEHELSMAASDDSSSSPLPERRSASEHDLEEARRRADALRTEVEEARADLACRIEARECECRLAEQELKDVQDCASSALLALDQHVDGARSRAEKLRSDISADRAVKRERTAKSLEDIKCLRAELEMARDELLQKQVVDRAASVLRQGDSASQSDCSDVTSRSVSSSALPGHLSGQEVVASAAPSNDMPEQALTPRQPRRDAGPEDASQGAVGRAEAEPPPERSPEGKLRRKLRRLRLERPDSPSGSDRSSPSAVLPPPSDLTLGHSPRSYTVGDMVGDTLLRVDDALSWLGEALQGPQAIGDTISRVDESLSWFGETPLRQENIPP